MTKNPNDKQELTDWEKRKTHIYKEAAKEATQEVLESFGFTVEEMEQMQRDLAFLRRLRMKSEAVGLKTATSLVALTFTLAGAAVTFVIGKFLGN